MTKIKLSVIGILAVVLAVVITWFVSKPQNVVPNFVPVGAPGNMLAEQYDPYIQYNGGFNTALGITNSGELTQSGAATLSSTLAVTGTTTITESVDGHVVGGTISTAATGTIRTVYTNSTGPKRCLNSTAFLYVKNNGSFAPLTRWSLGTSTSAIASSNLFASSTVATSTSLLTYPSAVGSFILAQNDVLTAIFDDKQNAEASTTYFGNLSAEAGVWCQDISI